MAKGREDMFRYYMRFVTAWGARILHEQWWREATQHYLGRNARVLRRIYFFNVFVPWTYTLTESITARVIQEIYSTYPLLTVRGRYGSADDELAKDLEDLLLWVFENDDFNFVNAMMSTVREAVLYGTGVFGLTEVAATDGDQVYMLPRLMWVPIVEIYVDPRATSLQDAEYLVRRLILPEEEFRRLQERHGWEVPREAGDPKTFQSNVSEFNRILGLQETPSPPAEGNVELWEFWEPESVCYIVNRFWRVGERELALGRWEWPYVECRWSGLPTSFWGIGVGRAIASLQRDLNILRMQRRHNVHMALNKVFVGLRGGVDPQQEFVLRPGGILWETRPGALRELPIGDVTGSSYTEESAIVRDIQMATGEFDYSLGIPPQRSRERAMTVMRIQEAALTRFSAFVRVLGSVTLRNVVKKVVLFLRLRLPRETAVRILGRSTRLYEKTPLQLLQLYDYVPYIGADTRIRESKLMTLVQAMPMLMQLPNIRKDWLAERFLRLLGLDEWKDAIRSDEEMMAQMQAMAMQAQGVGRGEE